MRLIKILLYALVFTFPLGVVVRIPVFASSFIYPSDVVLMILFFAGAFLMIRKGSSSLTTIPLLTPLYMFILFLFFSLVVNAKTLSSQHFFASFLYLARFILYAHVLLIFSFVGKSFCRRFPVILAVSGFLPVVFGLFQYIYYPSLRNLYYLGWDEHLYRVFSTFLDPNFAGALFTLEWLLLVSLFDREGFGHHGRRMLYALSIAFTTVAVFLTYSRSSLIMFFVSVAAYFLITGRRKAICMFLVVFAFGLILLPKHLGGEGLNLLRSRSVAARWESYVHAVSIFGDSPIFGVGFNAYRYAQKRHGFLGETDWEVLHSGAGVPNSFLFLLATTGIVGFLFYLNFWRSVFLWLRNALSSTREKKKASDRQRLYFYTASSITASLIGVFVHSLFENTLFYPSAMLWLFSLIGVFRTYFKTSHTQLQ